MGFIGFATVPGLQTRVMEAAGSAGTLASAANIAAFNLGNAAGAWLGGVAIGAGFGSPRRTLSARSWLPPGSLSRWSPWTSSPPQAGPWELGMTNTALVVGARGVIGGTLADHLAGLPDWDVIGVSRRGGTPVGRVRYVAVDLFDPGPAVGSATSAR